MDGFINDVAIGPRARFCVAAVGQEPRLGRWDRVPSAKNRFAIIPLRENVEDNEDHIDDEMQGHDNKDEDDITEEASDDSSDED